LINETNEIKVKPFFISEMWKSKETKKFTFKSIYPD